jgi:hypothetical protein
MRTPVREASLRVFYVFPEISRTVTLVFRTRDRHFCQAKTQIMAATLHVFARSAIMPPMRCVTSSSGPYVDGNQVLFEIKDDSGEVLCSISRLALEVVSDGRFFRPVELLAGFKKSRKRIEEAAIRKWHARPEGVSGRLHLWADDVEDPPTDGLPVASCGAASPPAAG